MSFKIQTINNALEVSDTVSGEILISQPARDTWFAEEALDEGFAKFYGTTSTNEDNLKKYTYPQNYDQFKGFPIVDCVDSGDVAFTATSFRDFCYQNLAFSQAPGSGASGESGYSHTGAFADKPTSNNYVWEAGTGVNYTAQNVADGDYKVFSLNRAVHEAVDNPYWSDPTPSGVTGIGLFQGANLPQGVDTLVDYDYVYNDNYNASGTTGYEDSTGRIDLSDCVPGDQLRVRFDFNIIPQIANTTVEPALWYSNRDDSGNITFTFPLTTQPIFYGGGTVGNTYLNRVEISAWITSQEDVNALVLPAIKSDNPVIIQPLGLLITIIR